MVFFNTQMLKAYFTQNSYFPFAVLYICVRWVRCSFSYLIVRRVIKTVSEGKKYIYYATASARHNRNTNNRCAHGVGSGSHNKIYALFTYILNSKQNYNILFSHLFSLRIRGCFHIHILQQTVPYTVEYHIATSLFAVGRCVMRACHNGARWIECNIVGSECTSSVSLDNYDDSNHHSDECG